MARSGICSVGRHSRVVAGQAQLQHARAERAHVLRPHRLVLQVFRKLPRPVVGLPLRDSHQLALPDVQRRPARSPLPAVVAGFQRDERRDVADRRHERRARHRKVADVGAIGALAVVDAVDDFRDQAVDVEIPLAMAVRAHVHRHVVDQGREIGAVIEVEAAQEVLVGLARTGVLDGDQPGHGLEQLGNSQQRPDREVGAADGPLAGGVGPADERLAACEHDDFLEHIVVSSHRRGAGEQRRHAKPQTSQRSECRPQRPSPDALRCGERTLMIAVTVNHR